MIMKDYEDDDQSENNVNNGNDVDNQVVINGNEIFYAVVLLYMYAYCTWRDVPLY